MQKPTPQPINRSPLRLALGRKYFTLKRYFMWAFGGVRFAKARGQELPYEYFSHKTPLVRQLKNVEMYLQYNKIENLKIAVKRINGIMLLPGETFSYWRLIGKPMKRKGYLDGMVLQNGSFKAGVGGGLCQLSNLIYWMSLHTPLTITERHRHGYDVFPDSNRTQPFGSGATCFYNYVDLMIRNDTNKIFQLVVKVGENDLEGAWRTEQPPELKYEVYEKKHFIRSEYWGGYTRHNYIFRKKCDMSGSLIGDEYVAENHAVMMYSPLITKND